MALKQLDNKQWRPWTTLKPSAFACGFQNGPASFKTVQPALKPMASFETGRVSNRSVIYISRLDVKDATSLGRLIDNLFSKYMYTS